MFAKSDSQYYYLNNKECEIAIPINFYIPSNFSKNQINFLYKTKTIMVSTSKKNELLAWVKKDTQLNNDILIEDKNISCLSYQKYKIIIGGDTFEYRHVISGKDFYFISNDVKQKNIDYIVNHCLETYKKRGLTLKN